MFFFSSFSPKSGFLCFSPRFSQDFFGIFPAPGTFTGIFAGGCVEYLGAERALERQQAKDERLRVMAMAVPGISKRRNVWNTRPGHVKIAIIWP